MPLCAPWVSASVCALQESVRNRYSPRSSCTFVGFKSTPRCRWLAVRFVGGGLETHFLAMKIENPDILKIHELLVVRER